MDFLVKVVIALIAAAIVYVVLSALIAGHGLIIGLVALLVFLAGLFLVPDYGSRFNRRV